MKLITFILSFSAFFFLSWNVKAYDFNRFSNIFQQHQQNNFINTDEGWKKFTETLREEADRQNRQHKKEDLGNPHYKIEGFK